MPRIAFAHWVRKSFAVGTLISALTFPFSLHAESVAHWTPVPLPDEISATRGPHTNNIRAEIEQAAKLFDVDVRMMKAFAEIESGYNPKARTGSYKCLFQLSDWEFAKYWQGDMTSETAQSQPPESLRLRRRSSRRTSVVRSRPLNSTASTSKAIKAVLFTMPRHNSWLGRTCT